MHSRIAGTGSYLPGADPHQRRARAAHRHERRVDPRAHRHTRAAHRRAATRKPAISRLHAARAALAAAGIAPEDVDLIIVATTTPDMVFPSTACILQAKLGAVGGPAFDVQAVCSGFVYALAIADKFVASGMARNALVVGAEIYSRILDWNDRGIVRPVRRRRRCRRAGAIAGPGIVLGASACGRPLSRHPVRSGHRRAAARSAARPSCRWMARRCSNSRSRCMAEVGARDARSQRRRRERRRLAHSASGEHPHHRCDGEEARRAFRTHDHDGRPACQYVRRFDSAGARRGGPRRPHQGRPSRAPDRRRRRFHLGLGHCCEMVTSLRAEGMPSGGRAAMNGSHSCFPGQGSQSVGMLAGLRRASGAFGTTFDEARDVARAGSVGARRGRPGRGAQRDGQHAAGDADRGRARSGALGWRRVAPLPAVVAGPQPGRIHGARRRGRARLRDAVPLVRFRAQAMQEAVPAGLGAMAAILGLDDRRGRCVCQEAGRAQVVEPVNFNAPEQVVIAGHKEAVERAIAIAKERGAKRGVLLPVSRAVSQLAAEARGGTACGEARRRQVRSARRFRCCTTSTWRSTRRPTRCGPRSRDRRRARCAGSRSIAGVRRARRHPCCRMRAGEGADGARTSGSSASSSPSRSRMADLDAAKADLVG